jgi:histidinol-phosphate aminotransferase
VPALEGVRAYRTPPPSPAVDLRLDGNEGAVPPASLLETLPPLGPEVVRCYPDATALEALLAQRLGVQPGQVLATAGGDDAIDRICRAFLAPGRQLILPEPSFEMIGRYAALVGAEVVSVPWPGGPFPTEEIVASAGPHTAMIAVVSPNNPTGAVATPADLTRLAGAVPQALLMVDLAYTEFATKDLTGPALELSGAVVVRSLSKAWGLAGLRVGYAVGPARTIDVLRAAGHPYAVSGPSLHLAAARLEDAGPEVPAFIDRVRQERETLVSLLGELGARPQPSQANFVLARFADAALVHESLAALGIAVRIFPSRAELEGALRITCPGNPAGFERLSVALRTVLAPEALLFDLDGVLADVSGSYRSAILSTADSFGVRLEPEEIAAAKREPGANNDWVLTRRLLEKRGVTASLDDVTERFEALYQGTPERPGLHARETLIPSRDRIRRLGSRLPLALVTGRPRTDAVRFLEHAGIGDCFRELVCMEDAAVKPDPAPVRLALERLGVEHAWMVGDTPDDILAARGAGAVPFGIVAPGDDRDRGRAALTRAGAARVLAGLDELEELVP